MEQQRPLLHGVHSFCQAPSHAPRHPKYEAKFQLPFINCLPHGALL